MNENGKRLREEAEVVGHEALGGEQQLLVLKSPRIAALARPGNFVLIGVRPTHDPSPDPVLPRPFSLMGARPESGTIEIFYRVAGRGTSLMRSLRDGDRIGVMGPLGKPWPPSKGRAVLAAGGVGMPPLLFLAEELGREPGSRPAVTLFYGGRTAEHISLVHRFEAAGVEVNISTDDGSLGRRGNCVEALEEWAATQDLTGTTIFGCGPERMLAAVAELAGRRGIEAYVSLESPMACGIGVCRGCPVPRKDGSYAMCCTDGPIFRADEMDFP